MSDVGLNAIRGGIMGGDEYRVLNVPRASVYASAVQSMADNVPATITLWDTVDYDTDGMWDSGNSGFFKVKTPGVYRVTFTGAIVSSGAVAGWRQAYFRKSSAGRWGFTQQIPPGSFDWAFSTSDDIPLNKDDTVDCVAGQFSGVGPLNFQAATSIDRLNGFKICLISTLG